MKMEMMIRRIDLKPRLDFLSLLIFYHVFFSSFVGNALDLLALNVHGLQVRPNMTRGPNQIL